jgi:hypothetical protein
VTSAAKIVAIREFLFGFWVLRSEFWDDFISELTSQNLFEVVAVAVGGMLVGRLVAVFAAFAGCGEH